MKHSPVLNFYHGGSAFSEAMLLLTSISHTALKFPFLQEGRGEGTVCSAPVGFNPGMSWEDG